MNTKLNKIVKELTILCRNNNWGESLTRKPLKIRFTKQKVNPLILDQELREQAFLSLPEPDDRHVLALNLTKVINSLIDNTTDSNQINYYLSLRNIFNQLDSPIIYYVDSPVDPDVSVILTGKLDHYTIYATTLLFTLKDYIGEL